MVEVAEFNKVRGGGSLFIPLSAIAFHLLRPHRTFEVKLRIGATVWGAAPKVRRKVSH